MFTGLIHDSQLEACHRHPWLRARVLRHVQEVVRHGAGRVRQNHQLLRNEPNSVCYRRLQDRPAKEVCPITRPPCSSRAHSSSVKSRQVSIEEGQELAKQTHSAYVETSAKANSNVGEYSHTAHFHRAPLTGGRVPPAKVFELCLGEIEKRSPSSKTEPPTSKCTIQ